MVTSRNFVILNLNVSSTPWISAIVMMTCICMSCRLYVAIFYNHTIISLCMHFFNLSVLTLIIKLTEYFVGKGTEYGVVGPCHCFCRIEMFSQFIGTMDTLTIQRKECPREFLHGTLSGSPSQEPLDHSSHPRKKKHLYCC